MYDVIRQVERIGENHDQRRQHHQHHHHHHQSSVNHVTYHPTSFRHFDPRQAYSLCGLYASDAMMPTTGIYRSNYSPVSPGTAWAEYIPAQHPKWSKPVIVDTGMQWDQRQRQYGCPMVADVSGTYRHGSVISNTVTPPTVTGTSGLAAASRLSRCSSPGLASSSSSLAASMQRQQHCVTSRAHSSVTCVDDDDVTPRCGAAASPQSATYQPSSSESASNIFYVYSSIYIAVFYFLLRNNL